MAEPTLRESLLAAQTQVTQAPAAESTGEVEPIETAPETPDERAPEHAEEAPQEQSEVRPARPRDEAGRFAKEQVAAAAKAMTAPAKPATAPAAAPTDAPRPPASWKPAVREHWNNLHPDVRNEIARRERETAVAVQQAAEHRKSAEAFTRTIEPYRAFIQGEPTQVVGNLLQTAVALQTGTPQQKAAIAAQIVTSYGVDIEHLAAALDGKALPAQAQQPQQFRDPRFDQFLGQLQQVQTQRAQQSQAEAAQQLQAFATAHEFLEDVRDDMADLMTLSRQRGREMSLEDAYERACLANPDVRPLFTQRRAAQEAANARASTQRARAAASSVRHEPTAPAAGAQSPSLRDTILAAMSTGSRR